MAIIMLLSMTIVFMIQRQILILTLLREMLGQELINKNLRIKVDKD